MNNNDIVGRLAKEIMPTLALTRLVFRLEVRNANLKFEGCITVTCPDGKILVKFKNQTLHT